jgi:hypothetical protein
VALHVGEAAVLEDRVPAALLHRDVEEGGDAPDLARQVRLELAEVHEQQVRQVPYLPPAPDVLPERPERVAVLLHPLEEVLADRRRRPADRRADQARRVVERRYQSSLALAWWLYRLQTTSRPSRPT